MSRYPHVASRQLEGEAEYVGALVKSQSLNLWVAVMIASMLSAIAIPISVLALVTARNNHVAVDGTPGAIGPRGPAGLDGRNGTNGLDGDRGLDGRDGLNGSTQATEVQFDDLRGLKAFDALTVRLYDNTPGFASRIILGPSATNTLTVATGTGAGVGIGTATLSENVALEIHQSLGALLLPRLSSAARNVLEVPLGSLVFDTNLQAVCVYAGTGQWYSLTMSVAP